MPQGDLQEQIMFMKYAKAFIKKAWRPEDTVRTEDVVNFRTFLEKYSNYPGPRKRALLELRESLNICHTKGKKDVAACKGFIKFECYDEPKAPRAINSPSDESKTILAALCHAVDKKTFAKKWFVKGSNPKTWPTRLEDTFGGSPVVGTDFTSFEAHHAGFFASIVKFWWLHMVRQLPGAKALKDLVSYLLSARNECSFKHVHASVDERLMSGALWTSSANGMLNLLLCSYLSARAVNPLAGPDQLAAWAVTDFKGFCEGDDGICLDVGQDELLAQRLGLRLKWEHAPDYSKAGFCGIVCQRGKHGVLKDPISVIRKFFTLEAKTDQMRPTKQSGLMRAKALSYKYTFGNCPVIGHMCDWVLRITKGVTIDIKAVRDVYERDRILEALEAKAWREATVIDIESRELVESRFGMTIEQQVQLEKVFSECTTSECHFDLSGFMKPADFYHVQRFLFKSETGKRIFAAPPISQEHPDLMTLINAMKKPVIRSPFIKQRAERRAKYQLCVPGVVNDLDIAIF